MALKRPIFRSMYTIYKYLKMTFRRTKDFSLIFDHAWFIHRRHKPLVVSFSSSKLLSKLEKETFSCSFFIIKTFVKIGEGNKKGEGVSTAW